MSKQWVDLKELNELRAVRADLSAARATLELTQAALARTQRERDEWEVQGLEVRRICFNEGIGAAIHFFRNEYERNFDVPWREDLAAQMSALRREPSAPVVAEVAKPEKCADCGIDLNDGTAKTFTVCDACWEKAYPPAARIHGWTKSQVDIVADLQQRVSRHEDELRARSTPEAVRLAIEAMDGVYALMDGVDQGPRSERSDEWRIRWTEKAAAAFSALFDAAKTLRGIS